MCQFNHLVVGERVTLLTEGHTQCTSCSSGVDNYTGPAIYQGHQNNGDMVVDSFSILGNWQCICGKSITQYITPCDDYGALFALPLYKFDLSEVTNANLA